MKEKLYDVLGRVLDIKREEISDDTSPLNTPTWDSFNAIMMIAELEKSSSAKFDLSDLMSVKNVGDIKKILEKYNVSYEC